MAWGAEHRQSFYDNGDVSLSAKYSRAGSKSTEKNPELLYWKRSMIIQAYLSVCIIFIQYEDISSKQDSSKQDTSEVKIT